MKPRKKTTAGWSRLAGVTLATSLVFTFSSSVHAADWTGATGSNWNTATNWVGETVPNSAPAAIQSIPENIATISENSTFSPSEIIIGGWWANGRLDHTAGSLTTSNPGWPPGWMLVGFGAQGNASYNLANTATTGGTYTGYGTGSGTTNLLNALFLGEPNGGNGNGNATVNVNTTGALNVSGNINVGVSGWNGIMNLDAGAVTATNLYVGRTVNGAAIGGTGSFNMSGGSVTLIDRLHIGSGDGAVPASANVGTVTLSGGTLRTDNLHNDFWAAGVSLASATWNGVNGSGVGGNGGTATFHLDGGVLSTFYVFSETRIDNMGTPDDSGDDVIYAKGTSTFYFNGGTLRAQGNRDVPWFPFMGYDLALTNAYVKEGGAIFDSNGYDLLMGQRLLADPDSTGGGLIKNGAGRLVVTSQNTFTGPVVVNEGTLVADVGNAPTNRAFSYASSITVNSGAILNAATNSLFGWDGSQAKPLTVESGATAIAQYGDQNVGLVMLHGGTLASLNPDPNWGSWNFGRAPARLLLVTENSAVTAEGVGFQNGAEIEVDPGKTLTFSGTITNKPDGISSLSKWGKGTLILSGANTYTGNTNVHEGTVSMTSATLNDASTLFIEPNVGVVLNLNHGDTDVIAALYVDGVEQTAGLYRAPDAHGGSGDGNQLVGLTGTGKLLVGAPATGYAAWAAANVGGAAPDVDSDQDGVPNGVEYFMNAGIGFTPNPGLDGTNTVTWPNGGNIPAAGYGTQYVVEISPDLSDWTPVPNNGSDTNLVVSTGSVSYTITGTGPKFARLAVTPH